MRRRGNITPLRRLFRKAKLISWLFGVFVGMATSFHGAWGLTFARAERLANDAAQKAVAPVAADYRAHKAEVDALRPVMDRTVDGMVLRLDRIDSRTLSICQATPGADCR